MSVDLLDSVLVWMGLGMAHSALYRLYRKLRESDEQNSERRWEMSRRIEALENLHAGIISSELPSHVLQNLGYDQNLRPLGEKP